MKKVPDNCIYENDCLEVDMCIAGDCYDLDEINKKLIEAAQEYVNECQS